MQSQRWHKKEKDNHHAQLDEEQQHKPSEFLFIDEKEVTRPPDSCTPKKTCRGEIEQRKDKADDKCGEEEVSEENNFVAFHAAHYLFQRLQINHKGFARLKC
jgi:hypothetical protein